MLPITQEEKRGNLASPGRRTSSGTRVKRVRSNRLMNPMTRKYAASTRSGKTNKISNEEWVSKTDPNSRIAHIPRTKARAWNRDMMALCASPQPSVHRASNLKSELLRPPVLRVLAVNCAQRRRSDSVWFRSSSREASFAALLPSRIIDRPGKRTFRERLVVRKSKLSQPHHVSGNDRFLHVGSKVRRSKKWPLFPNANIWRELWQIGPV